MKFDKILLGFSIILVALSIIFLILTIFFPGTLDSWGITGFATAGNTTSGKLNLTVNTGLVINFTWDSIEWGSGRVDPGSSNATLDTSRTSWDTKVIGGNWTGVYDDINKTNGLVLQNIGNVNATIYLRTSQNATTMIGGTAGEGPLYQFNVTNNDTGESCANASGLNLKFWNNVNLTEGDGTRICDNFSFVESADQIKIDILLRIPSDSKTGYMNDTITMTAYQAT